MPYSYSCSQYPGMEGCAGFFVADSEQELWKHLELHGREAHGEDPALWSQEEVQTISGLIRRT